MPISYENKKAAIPDYTHYLDNDKHSNLLSFFFRSNKWRLFLSLLLFVIKESPVYIVPICTSNLINITDAIMRGASVEENVLGIVINAVVTVVSLLQNILTHTIYAKITDNLLRNASAGIREAVVRKLQHLSFNSVSSFESGKIESKFLRDVENAESYLGIVVKNFIPSLVTTLVAIGISLYYNYWLTLFFVAIIPLNVIVSRFFVKKIKRNSHDYRVASEDLSKRFVTMIEMIPITKAHGLESTEINAMDEKVKDVRSKGLRADGATAVFGSAVWVVSNLMAFACLIFSCFLAIKGLIKIGDVVLYESLFASINGNVLGLVNLIPSLAQGKESLRSLSEIMSAKEVEDEKGKDPVEDIKGQVDFENVSFSYPNSKIGAIVNLSFSAKAGECLAVVGPSGSGKTTLMNLILGLLPPSEGKVLIDGKDLSSISLVSYRHHISLVPQNPVLFPGTIQENITYGLEKYSDEDIKQSLILSNSMEFVSNLPQGINTYIEEHGSNLSGGQRQRITIARALIRNPSLLIFDEATSALDNVSEFAVQKAINQSMKGRTTFIVAHRLSTIRGATRIMFLDQGRIVEEGTYDELMAKKGRFYKMKVLSEAKDDNGDFINA